METPDTKSTPDQPRPLFGTEPPPPYPPPRRFAWGTFFAGVGTGAALTVALLVAFAVGIAMIASRITSDDADYVNRTIPAPSLPAADKLTFYGEADPSWTIHTLAGASAKLGNYRGKVVFVNLWATWCGPCVSEMPTIARLREKLKDAPVEFLLISDEDAKTITDYRDKRKWQLPLFRSEGTPPSVFHTMGIPATFIVDPRGMVVYQHIGMARWDADAVVTFLRNLSS